MNFKKICLNNDTKIIVDNFSPYDIFIGITDKGFDYDYKNNTKQDYHIYSNIPFSDTEERTII